MREICTPKHKTYKHTTWYDCVTNVTTTCKAQFQKKNSIYIYIYGINKRAYEINKRACLQHYFWRL
jgi:hypothetical protein